MNASERTMSAVKQRLSRCISTASRRLCKSVMHHTPPQTYLPILIFVAFGLMVSLFMLSIDTSDIEKTARIHRENNAAIVKQLYYIKMEIDSHKKKIKHEKRIFRNTKRIFRRWIRIINDQ